MAAARRVSLDTADRVNVEGQQLHRSVRRSWPTTE
jgi:hypothetical protein